MGRESKFCEAPTEFNITRYELIPSLSNLVIANLLDWRRITWLAANSNPEKMGDLPYRLLSSPLAMANPQSIALMDAGASDFIDEQLVSEPSVKDILKYADSYREFKQTWGEKRPDVVCSDSDPGEQYFDASIGLHHLESYQAGFNPSEVLVKINLRSKNEAIIEALDKFITKLRRTRGFDEPATVRSTGINSFRDKIVRYHLIPYIDLCIWEVCSNNQIAPKHKRAALGYSKNRDLRTIDSAADQALDHSIIESLKVVQYS